MKKLEDKASIKPFILSDEIPIYTPDLVAAEAAVAAAATSNAGIFTM